MGDPRKLHYAVQGRLGHAVDASSPDAVGKGFNSFESLAATCSISGTLRRFRRLFTSVVIVLGHFGATSTSESASGRLS